jgi:Rrf2 family nitric oxide-sensitive transcriptional repressor
VQLSRHADYALRVLIYVGSHPDAMVSTSQISRAYGISKNHLVRVVQTLAARGYLHVTPGRAGGMRLARDPAQIRLGQVVRDTEPSLRLVECFDRKTNTCPIVSVCGLKPYLQEALEAFLNELDRHTLGALLAGRRKKLRDVLVPLGPLR